MPMSRRQPEIDAPLGLSLYVHVPFCRQRCPFCASYGVAGAEGQFDAFLRALQREWSLAAAEETECAPESRAIASIYVGGGTPSMPGHAFLQDLLGMLTNAYPVREDCEITVQLNPEDVDRELARALVAAGFGRVSLGVQSFDDQALRAIGRGHSGQDATAAIESLREAGCENLSLDLMFGLPGQSLGAWEETLARALLCGPQHLGVHPLTRAEATTLDRLLTGSFSATPLSEETWHPYQRAAALLSEHGYTLYEITNAALPGYECRHLLGVWSRAPLLGLGPAAHSLCGNRRWRTVCDLDLYLRSLRAQQRPPRDSVRLDALDQAREEIYLGLRRARGFTWAPLEARLPQATLERMRRKVRFLAAQGYLELDEQGARLQPQARYVCDSVALELINAVSGGAE
ncbi:MAG: radical SAM family heme chaperone HemW [Candidatus Eisenbacteria bacterium]|nr:radical SAM family heme chaperone HemW [Candidatus Eisenbacteria bacterium]